jgi:hypothetical protein
LRNEADPGCHLAANFELAGVDDGGKCGGRGKWSNADDGHQLLRLTVLSGV